MDYALLDFFANHIIQVTPADNSTSEGSSILDHSLNQNQGFKFGLTDGLPELIRRVSSLHRLSLKDPSPKSEIICESVTIWHDLNGWNPPAALLSTEYHKLYASYTSALFIWLYFIVHPDSIHDSKVQTMVKMGLADMEDVHASELVPLLLIPLFVHGLASVQLEDRDSIERLFDGIQMWGNDVKWRVYHDIVEKSWRKHDAGGKHSWDWTC